VTIFRPGAVAAVVILTVFAHGLQAGDLGLYWDDAEQLMQGLQGVDYRVLDFIVSDTAHSLPSERPLAYLAFVLTRAAFAFSVGAVHWTLVAWLALDAALLGSLARTIVDDDWFVFAVGTTFVLYPLAFLQTIWPATIHYHLAWFFASVAMLAAGKSASVDPRRARWWLACGALAYATSLLTQEAVGFIPLAFVGLHALSGRRAVRAAITLGGVFALFALWRTLLLPLYGDQFYSPSMPFLHPGVVISKALRNATAAALFPWRSVADQWRSVADHIVRWTTVAGLSLAFVIGASTWLVSERLLRSQAPIARDAAAEYADGAASWLRAAALGVAFLLAGVFAVALSPINIEMFFQTSYGPRANFVVVPGIALAAPAVLMVLARIVRLPHWAVSALLALLVFVGSLLHFDTKQGYSWEWTHHKAMLMSLRELAPRVAPDTVIVIATARDRRAPYSAHYEISSYLLALYDEWSVMGNTVRHLRFHRDGVDTTDYGSPGRWFPHGVKGPIDTTATRLVGRIPYERLLLFDYSTDVLRAVPELEVTAVDGQPIRLSNNPARVRAGPPLVTPIWLHITR